MFGFGKKKAQPAKKRRDSNEVEFHGNSGFRAKEHENFYHVDDVVYIKGLKTDTRYNGRKAKVVVPMDERGRVQVILVDRGLGLENRINLKLDHMEKIGGKGRTVGGGNADCAVSTKAGSIRHGFLSKEGGYFKTWKKRFLILSPDGLSYYEQDPDNLDEGKEKNKLLGQFHFANVIPTEVDGNDTVAIVDETSVVEMAEEEEEEEEQAGGGAEEDAAVAAEAVAAAGGAAAAASEAAEAEEEGGESVMEASATQAEAEANEDTEANEEQPKLAEETVEAEEAQQVVEEAVEDETSDAKKESTEDKEAEKGKAEEEAEDEEPFDPEENDPYVITLDLGATAAAFKKLGRDIGNAAVAGAKIAGAATVAGAKRAGAATVAGAKAAGAATAAGARAAGKATVAGAKIAGAATVAGAKATYAGAKVVGSKTVQGAKIAGAATVSGAKASARVAHRAGKRTGVVKHLFRFDIKTTARTYKFSAPNEKTLRGWVEDINTAFNTFQNDKAYQKVNLS